MEGHYAQEVPVYGAAQVQAALAAEEAPGVAAAVEEALVYAQPAPN